VLWFITVLPSLKGTFQLQVFDLISPVNFWSPSLLEIETITPVLSISKWSVRPWYPVQRHYRQGAGFWMNEELLFIALCKLMVLPATSRKRAISVDLISFVFYLIQMYMFI